MSEAKRFRPFVVNASPRLLLLASIGLAAPATAQPGEGPPLFRQADQNGVDLVTGSYETIDEVLPIGTGPAALKLKIRVDYSGLHTNFDGQATVGTDNENSPFAESWFEADKNTYTGPGPNWSSDQGDGATLSLSGGNIIWTRSDGTTILFRTDVVPSMQAVGWSVGYPTEITYPGGHKIRITYKPMPELDCQWA